MREAARQVCARGRCLQQWVGWVRWARGVRAVERRVVPWGMSRGAVTSRRSHPDAPETCVCFWIGRELLQGDDDAIDLILQPPQFAHVQHAQHAGRTLKAGTAARLEAEREGGGAQALEGWPRGRGRKGSLRG